MDSPKPRNDLNTSYVLFGISIYVTSLHKMNTITKYPVIYIILLKRSFTSICFENAQSKVQPYIKSDDHILKVQP